MSSITLHLTSILAAALLCMVITDAVSSTTDIFVKDDACDSGACTVELLQRQISTKETAKVLVSRTQSDLLASSSVIGRLGYLLQTATLPDVFRLAPWMNRSIMSEARRGFAKRTGHLKQGASSNASRRHLEPGDDPRCDEMWQYCTEPLNCDTDGPTAMEQMSWAFKLSTPDNHANLKSWCWDASFASSVVEQCLIKKDLTASAHATYRKQVDEGLGEIDGSYCFLAGHCLTKGVTNATTVGEAEGMCTRKFGSESEWANFGMKDLNLGFWMQTGALDREEGILDKTVAMAYVKLACAMGNYHCDVVYCQETFCKDPYYTAKYGRYLRGEDP